VGETLSKHDGLRVERLVRSLDGRWPGDTLGLIILVGGR
jgi:hypothetical protein